MLNTQRFINFILDINLAETKIIKWKELHHKLTTKTPTFNFN